MYAKDDPRCSPLVLNVAQTQYEEWSWLNLAEIAEQGQCYLGNPEDYADYVDIAGVNCYGMARYIWECGGYCNSNVDEDRYQLKLGRQITLEAGRACQYKVWEPQMTNGDKRWNYFIKKDNPDLRIWAFDRTLRESEFR